MPEPGSAEGQGNQAPKTASEPFTRETGDMTSFSDAAKSASLLGNQESFTRQEGSDIPSLTEAGNKFTEILHTPSDQLMKEFGEVSENVNRQAGAVNLVDGIIEWARTTKDSVVEKMLAGNIGNMVQRLAANPDKVSEAVASWTEEDRQKFTKELKDKGMIGNELSFREAINKFKVETHNPPSAIEPPITTAK